uniref:Carboxypeptidase n=1 Tax=Chlamydomonas leiostraca TaxID=1034604 RepID=A0A7S0WF48_9CHLO
MPTMASERRLTLALALICSTLIFPTLGARVQRQQGDLHSSSRQRSEDIEQADNKQNDLIDAVPGFDGELPSKHYGGYIPVGTSGKRLYYYFVEAETDPSEAPVVLWLNGGPGCSSFDGFVYEHGPFNFRLADTKAGQGVKLTLNSYAWNKVANMLFLDSPAGVGLSYSEAGPRDYRTDDLVTAADAEEFLRKWFTRYTQFQSSRFFISGESYAGMYVPNLARAVVEGNEDGAEPYINIEGYLIGNAVTDTEVDGNALPLFAAGKSLISQAQYDTLWKRCDGGNFWNASAGCECDELLDDLVDAVSALNVYDVLEPCYLGPNYDDGEEDQDDEGEGWAKVQGAAKKKKQARLNSLQKALKSHGRKWPVVGSALPRVGERVHNWHTLGLTPPCTDARAASLWLNDDAVRSAIHAAPKQVIGEWTLCSNHLFYTRVVPSLIPTHKSLTQKHGLRALIYSGDHDMAVPHTGSEVWTSTKLDAPETAPWRPWMVASQVAGYVVDYGSLSYATVKGAGHMVPTNKPKESLTMFKRFLDGEPLA